MQRVRPPVAGVTQHCDAPGAADRHDLRGRRTHAPARPLHQDRAEPRHVQPQTLLNTPNYSAPRGGLLRGPCPTFARPSSDALRLPVIDSPVQPRPLPAVPDVGADLGWPLAARFADNPYRVAAGGRLLAPVFVWGPTCGTNGFAVVLKATGTVETVISQYAAQFVKEGLTEQERERGSSPGTILHASTAGGGDAHVTAITANSATYQLIDRCAD